MLYMPCVGVVGGRDGACEVLLVQGLDQGGASAAVMQTAHPLTGPVRSATGASKLSNTTADNVYILYPAR